MSPNNSGPQSHWILLRGLAREAAHWGEFSTQFAKAQGQRVTCLDLPGSGKRHDELSPTSISATTDALRAKWLELRTPGEKMYLLSLSLGGMVAVDWLSRFADDFTAAVLINTSFRGWSPFYERMRPSALRYIFHAAVSRDLEARETQVLKMVSNRPELREKTAREWAEIHHLRPFRGVNFLRQLLAAARFQPPMNPPKAPVLLLNSAQDRMVSPQCSAAIQARWQCVMKVHPSAGHDLSVDDTPWVISEINAWLAGS